MSKTVFFDLETGGLEPGVHPIIQIAAVAVDRDDFKPLDEIELKIKFSVQDCNDTALKVNSFDPEVWEKEAVDQQTAMKAFSAFLKKHATLKLISKRGNLYYVALMAGHNAASFDGPFIQKWYRAADEFLPGYFRVLCTSQLAQWYFYSRPDRKQPDNMKLGTLCKFFDIDLPEESAHDALADVRANVELCRALVERA